MLRCLSALIGFLLLGAGPAFAAPCTTQGAVDAPIPFPTNKMDDVRLARSMALVILPSISGAVPSRLTCSRAKVSTALGDYVVGGENGEAYPRVAMRADGKPGPVVYLAASPGASATFALVVLCPGSVAAIKRFYAGVPTDGRLREDIRRALADDSDIMAYLPERNMVRYDFTPPGGIPPPVEPESGPRGSVAAGPQILIPDSGNPAFLDFAHGMRHKPSGFACPQAFDGLAVVLMSIDPRRDGLICSYRAGTALGFRPDDPVRYELDLTRPFGHETVRSVFDGLTTSARATIHIVRDHAPPFAVGRPPAPEFVAYWDTEDAVEGVWVGKARGWIVWLRVQYPPSAANDAEAGKVAQTLFAEVAKQVR